MPQTLAPQTLETANLVAPATDPAALVKSDMDALSALGCFATASPSYADQAAIAKRAIAKRLSVHKSERMMAEARWKSARKAEDYALADHLKAILDATPKDNGSAKSALHSDAMILAPLQKGGASATVREAYRATVNALVRAHK